MCVFFGWEACRPIVHVCKGDLFNVDALRECRDVCVELVVCVMVVCLLVWFVCVFVSGCVCL